MHARLTLLEIDAVCTSTDAALEVFRTAVLPSLREQTGFRGVYVLANPDGGGVLLSFWDTAEQAESGADAGWYAAELAKYVTLFRAPPGRGSYEVRLVELTERSPAEGPG
ncbi:MAG: antibiotic biosynthesis monooxygenase family protein [Acidimicrobiales bacterium]